jgi:hypothetical protein
MPVLPAICDQCSTLFNSGFMAENSRNITIEDFTTGPCPHCGGMGHVPDGVLRRSNDATKARFSYCPNHRPRLSGALNDPVDVLEQNRRLYLAFQTASRQVEGFHARCTDGGEFVGATADSLILSKYYPIPLARFVKPHFVI